MDESSQQAEDQNMEEAGQQAENQNMEEAGQQVEDQNMEEAGQQAENQNVEEAGQQAENQNVEEAGQQAEDQNVEEAGDDTSDNAGQAGERREDNSNQDWENSNQDWGRKKRDSSDLTYVDPRDEDMFILELDKQKALKIIGARGGMVREITKQSKAFIKIDPDAEPAKIRISGSFTAVDRARAMVHDILNSEYDKPRPEWTDNWEDQMFRKCTKEESSRIIGPRGSNIQYIEKKSWAKVEVGDEEDGFIMVRVSGDFDAVDTALTMMSDAINNTGDWSKGSNDWGSDGDRGRKRKRFQDGEEPEATEKLVFEASYSGSIVGRGGKEINRLRSESGAEIDIQKIDNDENCEVTIRGSADEVAEAVKLVNAFVEETRQKRNRPGAVTETLQFQKRAAKEIIGRKGANIREVRETSGADIKIGDDWDKCLVTITGIPEQLSIAWTKIKELAGEEGWNPDGDEGQKNDVPYHSRNDKNWNNKDWNNKDWNNKWENKSDNKEMADACAGCGNKFTDMSAMFCVRCGSKRLSKADAQSQMNSQMGQMLEKQQRYQLIRQAQAKPPQPPPSGQLVPFVDGKSDGSAQNSGDWNANVAGANGNSMDLGSTASVIGLASAKSPPLSKAPLPTGRPPPSAIMKAPGGLPNKVPPKFGGLDALCDNIQSGPDFDSFEEPPSSEVMGAALMKAPAKGNVVPAKLGGILSKGKGKGGKFQPMQIPGKPDNSESWDNPKGKGKGGKFQPMQSFGKPDNSNSWDNSQDWQSGDDSNNDSWQQTPAVSKGMSKGPVQVPPRPAGPNFAFTQPAADDWDAGGADDWQSGNAWEFNSGQDNAFSQPGAEDDWSSAPSQQQQQQQPWGAKPQQLSLHPQPDATDDWGPSPAMQQLQQLQQQQTPKMCPGWVKRDPEIVKAVACHELDLLRYASTDLLSDTGFLKEFLQAHHGLPKPNSYHKRASEELQSVCRDREFMLHAVRQNGQALSWVSPDLCNDYDLVSTAVSKNGLAYHMSCAYDRDFLLMVAADTHQIFYGLPTALSGDQQFVLSALERSVGHSGAVLKWAAHALKSDREFLLACVEVNGLALEHVPSEMARDREIVLKAVRQNVLAMQWVHPDFLGDHAVLQTAALQLKLDGHRFLRLARDGRKKDRLIIGLEQRERELAQKLEEAGTLAQQHAANTSDLERRLQAERSTVSDLERMLEAERSKFQKIAAVLPQVSELEKKLQQIESLRKGDLIQFPVLGLRLTQRTVSRKWQFSNGLSMFKLFMQLMRGRIGSLAFTLQNPLKVYIHHGPDGEWGLYSNDNRRLVVFLMFQACHRRQHESCDVWCSVQGKIGVGESWPPGTHYDRNTDGLSIKPRTGLHASAEHRGCELFGNGPRAIHAFQRAKRFLRSQTPVRAAVDFMLHRVQVRSSSVAQSEESLYFGDRDVRLRPRSRMEGTSRSRSPRR